MIKRFARDNRGVAAVEFALIAPIFLALILSLFETGWLMTKIALADNAVSSVGRSIYTGAALSDATITQDSLKEEICRQIVIIGDCENNIELEVITINSFNDIPTGGEVCRDSFNGGGSTCCNLYAGTISGNFLRSSMYYDGDFLALYWCWAWFAKK